MKKMLIAFATFLTVWVCFVSCDKEQESRRISDNKGERTERMDDNIDSFISENYYADAKQLYFDEIIKNNNHPNYNNPELNKKEIEKILKIIQTVYNSHSLERDTVFDIYKIHGYYCYGLNSVYLNVNTELSSIQNLSQGIIPTGDKELDKVLVAYEFDSVSTFYGYPSFSWLTVFTKKEYNMIPIEEEFNQLESVLIAEFGKGCIGDGNNIKLIREESSDTIIFSIGRGDCPAGCTYRRYWEFKVSNGVAKFVKAYGHIDDENVFW